MRQRIASTNTNESTADDAGGDDDEHTDDPDNEHDECRNVCFARPGCEPIVGRHRELGIAAKARRCRPKKREG